MASPASRPFCSGALAFFAVLLASSVIAVRGDVYMSTSTGLQVSEPPCINLQNKNGESWKRMLNAANVARARHGSPALVWDWDLVAMAQAYAESSIAQVVARGGNAYDYCRITHNMTELNSYKFITETLDFRASGGPGVENNLHFSCRSSVEGWYDEIKDWVFGPNPGPRAPGVVTGHFEILVDRRMSAIGCGSWGSPRDSQGIQQCQITVCRYRWTPLQVPRFSEPDKADYATVNKFWPPLDNPPPEKVVSVAPRLLSNCEDNPSKPCQAYVDRGDCATWATVAWGWCPRSCGTCATLAAGQKAPAPPPYSDYLVPSPPPQPDGSCQDVWQPICALWKQLGGCEGKGDYATNQYYGKSITGYWCPNTCNTCGSVTQSSSPPPPVASPPPPPLASPPPPPDATVQDPNPPPTPPAGSNCRRPVNFCLSTNNTAYMVTDCDGDGRMDIACAEPTGLSVLLSSNGCLRQNNVAASKCPSAFYGGLGGSLNQCDRIPGWCTHPGARFMLADCNGDGILDLACRDGQLNKYIIISDKQTNTCKAVDYVSPLACNPAFNPPVIYT